MAQFNYDLQIDPSGELIEVWEADGVLVGYMRDEAVGNPGIVAMIRAGHKIKMALDPGDRFEDVVWERNQGTRS